ncbi:MAG: heme exporter protein CcmB [Planctomycetota bacterium]
MSNFFESVWAIFSKDIVTEFRVKQVLPTMVVLGMLIVWVMRLISESAAFDPAAMAPAVLWIALLFSGLLAQERSFATEEREDCIAGLLLAPVDPGTIYIAKLLVNIVMLCVFEIAVVPVVLFTFGTTISGRWIQFIAVLLLGNLGICSVGTLFSAMVQLSRVRGALLSILVLVILMPMMIPATSALLLLFEAVPQQLTGSGFLALTGNFKTAVGHMIAFDVVFTTACWLLFAFVVKE